MLASFELHYAPTVAAELKEQFASGREFWRLVREGVLTEVRPVAEVVRTFGPGERAAMDLALEHPDWILLVDDRRPLIEAQRLGIKTVCTPVLVVDLLERGRLTRRGAVEALARLAALRTVSPPLIEAALADIEAKGQGRG